MGGRFRRVVLAATAAAVCGVGLAGPASPATAEEADPAGQPQFSGAMVVEGWSVAVDRHGERLIAGRDITYAIAVTNRGETAGEVAIRAAVPPWMTVRGAVDGGEVGDGYVEWPVSVAPGEVALFQVTGEYAARETPPWVAFTACALDPGEQKPIVCGTDVAPLEQGAIRTWWANHRWWVLSGLGVLLVALGAGLAWLVLRRQRATTS